MRAPPKCPFRLPSSDLEEALRQSEGAWPELRDRHLFLTGGTGFFGKWLLGVLLYADEELQLGLRLTVLSRDPERFLKLYPELTSRSAVCFQAGDVADLPSARSGERYDFILHAASDTTGITTSAQEEERSLAIIGGTHRMLELTRQSGARRLLYVSSGAVYGAATAQLSGAKENDFATAEPVTSYARAKSEAEHLCLDSQLDTVTARAFAFLGPYLPLDAHYAAGNFLRDACRKGPIRVRGDGTALRSYLYPTDLVTWLLRILLRGEKGRPYNVGSDEAVTTAELARRVATGRTPTPEVEIQSVLPQGPQNIYLPDITRSGEELGLKVTVSLDESIRRTLAFLDSIRRPAQSGDILQI